MRSLDSGAAQSQITIISLTNYEIALPDRRTQETFDEFYSTIADQFEVLKGQVILLKEARDILLPRVMGGVIDVEKAQEESLAIAAKPSSKYKRS